MVRTWESREAARDGPFFAIFFPFSSNIPCAFSALGVSQWYDEWKLHPIDSTSQQWWTSVGPHLQDLLDDAFDLDHFRVASSAWKLMKYWKPKFSKTWGYCAFVLDRSGPTGTSTSGTPGSWIALEPRHAVLGKGSLEATLHWCPHLVSGDRRLNRKLESIWGRFHVYYNINSI